MIPSTVSEVSAMLVATMHFLTPSGACKHTTHQSCPWAWLCFTEEECRAERWGNLRSGVGYMLSHPPHAIPRYIYTSHLCSVLSPAPVFPVPTLITKHTSAPSGRSWPASPRAAESRLAAQQEQAPSPAPQGAPQFALRSPRHKKGCKHQTETRG